MYYSYVEIKYVATSFSPAKMDLAVKLLTPKLTHNSSALEYICNTTKSRNIAKAQFCHKQKLVQFLGTILWREVKSYLKNALVTQ